MREFFLFLVNVGEEDEKILLMEWKIQFVSPAVFFKKKEKVSGQVCGDRAQIGKAFDWKMEKNKHNKFSQKIVKTKPKKSVICVSC